MRLVGYFLLTAAFRRFRRLFERNNVVGGLSSAEVFGIFCRTV